jgi:2-dehydropantoate 2-reductase
LHYVIYGAGGIGGVIGARMHQAGITTTLIARGQHAEAIQTQGLRLIAPNEDVRLQLHTVTHPQALNFTPDMAVLLCMKSQHTRQALEDLAAVGVTDLPIVCVQNGVANESLALRFFPRVYATVVNLPAVFIHPGEVVTHASGYGGILDTGRYPQGVDATAHQIAADFSTAGFSAQPAARVMRQKYAKLLMNLFNVLQAGLTDFDNAGEIRRLIRSEALACFQAAGIDCATKAETEKRREGVYTMVEIPGYERIAGSSWQSMIRGTGDIETEYLNGEICWLGRMHGVPTPANDACVQLARDLVRAGQGPGLLTSETFAQRIEQLRATHRS